MALYLENPADTFTRRNGEPIGGVAHPRNIEQLWSAQELAAIGLYQPVVADPVPDGKRIVSTSVQRAGRAVKFVHVLEDIPPPSQEQLDAEAAEQAREDFIGLQASIMVQDTTLAEADKRKLAPLFPRWDVGQAVAIGDMRRHGEGLYRCVQAHTSQAGWEPPNVPALWVETLPSGTIGPWKQPAGAHDAYQIGDQVTHNNQTWTSTAANNVWEPGVYGWEVV